MNVPVELAVRNGALVSGSCGSTALPPRLLGCKLHEIRSWEDLVGRWLQDASLGMDPVDRDKISGWLEKMLPAGGARE